MSTQATPGLGVGSNALLGALRPSVDDAMRRLFDTPREPRSDAYKAGVRAALRKHLEGMPVIGQMQYRSGSAERDAFFAGTDEGHREAARLLQPNAGIKGAPRSGVGP